MCDGLPRRLCLFAKPALWDPTAIMPDPPHPRLALRADCADEDALRELVTTVYDIEADDRRLRLMAVRPAAERGPYFDHLRKTYPVRREFHNTVVDATATSHSLREKIAALGFRLAQP